MFLEHQINTTVLMMMNIQLCRRRNKWHFPASNVKMENSYVKL